MISALMDTFIFVALLLLCALWLVIFVYLFRAIKRIPELARQNVAVPLRWPKLSVVVPACNEAEHIESAAKTLIAQDYPDLEIILLNDRSTDTTAAIIDRLAESDARVKAIHIKTLPAGWLGKVHALDQGLARARGEWILCTDADVHFAPGILRRAIAFALDQRCDHLALIPRTIQSGFWLDVAVRAFSLLFIIGTAGAEVNRRGGKAFVGIGAFNLVKAETLRRTAGFSWLRLEPVDDVGLGLMIYQVGGYSRLALARDELSVRWYVTLAAMFKGLEKNLYGPTANYHWWLLLIEVSALASFAAAPLLAIGFGLALENLILLISGVGALTMLVAFSIHGKSEGARDVLNTLFFPAGLIIIAAMLLHAGRKCVENGGIDWRGTHYSLLELRQGQRVKLLTRRRLRLPRG
jgi:glycosyltransferase involved in cell wall biosynthesis